MGREGLPNRPKLFKEAIASLHFTSLRPSYPLADEARFSLDKFWRCFLTLKQLYDYLIIRET